MVRLEKKKGKVLFWGWGGIFKTENLKAIKSINILTQH